MELKFINSVSADEKPCFDLMEDLKGGNYGYLGEVYDEDTAAFIVKAVNNHESLLEALKSAREDIASYPRSLGYAITSLPKIDEAIKQAESVGGGV